MRYLAVATAIALAGFGTVGTYADPIDDAVEQVLPDNEGGGGRGLSSPIVGYIRIEYHPVTQGHTSPQVTYFGEFATGLLWTCPSTPPPYNPAVPYTITCTPNTGTTLVWHCDVLHADILTLTVGARARTSLDCNADAAPEAQTAVVLNPGYDWIWATSPVVVSQFDCTVDGGSFPSAPDFTAGCGDPGVVRFR